MNRKQRRKEERLKEKTKVEEAPQTFQMSYNLHRPWSDILFETLLPPTILEKMIEISDEVLADSKRIPWGSNLAGQIKEESLLPSELLKEENLLDFLVIWFKSMFINVISNKLHQININTWRLLKTIFKL